MKIILVDAVNTLVIKGQGIFPEMYELLEKYPNRKIILTGANDEQFKAFGLDKMPYEVFTLKHNPEKSDPKYFAIMLAHYGIKAEDTVYFEHNPEAVCSAQSLGIRAYFYNSQEKDLSALQNFLEQAAG